jgi:hypothetical protein
VFRRTLDGTDHRFSIAGLWGSGNTVAPRDEAQTIYTLWDGHALTGPGRPGRIERFPVFLAELSAREFLDRYGTLGDECRVWDGDEALGIGCEVSCAHLIEVCPGRSGAACLADCALLPRALVDCIGRIGAVPSGSGLDETGCDWEETCGRDAWDRFVE